MVRNLQLALTAVTLSLVGCEMQQGPVETAGADRVIVTPEHLNWITDVQWTLQSMLVDGRPVSLTQDPPYVRFDSDGRITGFGSVNRLFGLMQIETGGRVNWPGALASTRMAGPPPLMRQEETFMNALQAVRQWSIEGIKLYGHDTEGTTELVFSLPTP